MLYVFENTDDWKKKDPESYRAALKIGKVREIALEICKRNPSSSDIKKTQLLEMARNGDKRPSQRTYPLGTALGSYTIKGSEIFDEDFTKQIKEIAPDWFVSRSNTANTKKAQLLEIARNGEPRPHQTKHSLGRSLCSYTTKGRAIFDEDFTKQIKEIAPHWFENTANTKKAQLLEMARNGDKKPHRETVPGTALHSYTTKGRDTFDEDFTKELKEIAPDWFVSRSNTANTKKAQLLEIARNGEPRPHQTKHSLGTALGSYTIKGSEIFDEDFTKQIKEIAPHWFNSKKSSSFPQKSR